MDQIYVLPLSIRKLYLVLVRNSIMQSKAYIHVLHSDKEIQMENV